MPTYASLLGDSAPSKEVDDSDKPFKILKNKPAKPKKGLGCEFCPLDKDENTRKVKGLKRIKGRRMMLWSQAPGGKENIEGLELVGKAGQWFWGEAEKAGLYRDDFDIQNVVRCMPTEIDSDTGQVHDRPPTKDELKCCSIYNTEALTRNGGEAVVHVFLGLVPAKQVLGKEFKKDRPIFWSDKLNAKVICLDHPNFFLHGAPPARLESFRKKLFDVKKALLHPGKFAYIEEMDYRVISNVPRVKKYLKYATTYAAKGERVTVDVEQGWLDKHGNPCMDEDKRHEVMLCVGIGCQPGRVRIIPIDHPKLKLPAKQRRRILRYLKLFMEDESVEKTMHHGSSDCDAFQRLLDIQPKGYTWDTNYSTYLKWPGMGAYGLDKLSNTLMHDFSDYKDIIQPHIAEENPNYATIPLKVLRLYTGADCDMSKRLERKTRSVPQPLVTNYIHAAFTLADMEKRGPWFDYKWFNKVVEPAIPRKLDRVIAELQELARDPDLRLTQRQKVAHIIYGHNKKKYPDSFTFKLKPVAFEKGRYGDDVKPVYTTNKAAMELLAAKTGHPFPLKYKEWGRLEKMDSTYLKGYLASADLNGGWIRTIWWLTGTRTGRLRSGGGGEKRPGIVNAQNLHGDPILLNCLISDPNWRLVLKEAWREPSLWKQIRKLFLFLNYDYSQVEVRLLAHMSEDKLLIKQFFMGEDIHSLVGHELTGIPVATIKSDKKIRTMIKALHFGIVYGMGKLALFTTLISKKVKITRNESDELWDKYFKRYSRVRDYMNDMKAFVERHGYVETIFGFRRPLTHEQDEEDSGGSFWGNQAINSPIQGAAHQLLLIAMAVLHLKPKKFNRLGVPVAEVHDALAFFSALMHLPESVKQGSRLMEQAVPEYIEEVFGFKLKVPLVSEASAGFRLGSMVKIVGGEDAEPPKTFPIDKMLEGRTKSFIRTWKERNQQVFDDIYNAWDLAA